MSEQRRERRQKREQAPGKAVNRGAIAIYVVLLVVILGVGFFFYNRSQHQYDAFARCLGDRGVKMYGAWWCPHCAEQKAEFRASKKYLPYIECGVPGDVKGKNPVCVDEGIHRFPTWQFPPTGEREERVMSLEALSDRTGCPLP